MKPLTRIVHFCLEQADALPLSRRVALYRDLAAIAGTKKESTRFNSMASDLSAIDARHQQLALGFKLRSNGQEEQG